MQQYDAEVLFRPDDKRLEFLPEGPYPCGPERFSWVAIQHGPEAKAGSLNLFNLATGENVTHELKGQPGFAFATDMPDVFVVGMERSVVMFNTKTGEYSTLIESVDEDVEGTIINDGALFDGGLVFGTKDLNFKEKKAGLYLWRQSDGGLFRLRSDQICSNGKVVCKLNGQPTLLDIDSPEKTVVAYPFSVEDATIGDPQVIIDLQKGDVFPDGMVLTPDGKSVIVAMYNPSDAWQGEAKQFRLSDGQLEEVWQTKGSPQVTCPLLMRTGGHVKLILTTAAEHMSADKHKRHPDAGCIFIAETEFDGVPDQPVFRLP